MVSRRAAATQLEFSREYSMEQLFDLLRDMPFEAGHPMLISQESGSVIVWPPMNRHNQIQIVRRGSAFFCICSRTVLGSLRAPAPSDTDGPFDGLLFWLEYVLRKKRSWLDLTRRTGQQINALLL